MGRKAERYAAAGYERGLLDLDNICISDFSEKGKQHKAGNVIKGTSLEMLLLSYTDFIEEESLLQMNVQNNGGDMISLAKVSL